jgi:hypothetical protein
LCWHHCPCRAGFVALIVLALSPLSCWRCPPCRDVAIAFVALASLSPLCERLCCHCACAVCWCCRLHCTGIVTLRSPLCNVGDQNISYVCKPARAFVDISYVSDFAVGECTTCKPLTQPSPPFCNIHVQKMGSRQISATNSYVGATKMSRSCSCALFSWPNWLFEQNRFILTFPLGKGRSGQRHLC